MYITLLFYVKTYVKTV